MAMIWAFPPFAGQDTGGPHDINLWRYLLLSVEKSSMRDHYSFGCWMAADSIVRLAPRVTK